MQNDKLKFKSFKIYTLVLSFTFLALDFALAKTVEAQTFSLSPSMATKSANLEFAVDLNIDTGGKRVTAADVKMTFDSDILLVTKIQDGTFFTATSHNIYTGTLYVGGAFSDATQTASGSGKLATLTLKGRAAGTSQLAFICSTQTTDSNILDNSTTPKDIINCAGIKDGSYTFTSTGTELATPVPEAPVTGLSLPTIMAFGFGFFLIVMGLVFIF